MNRPSTKLHPPMPLAIRAKSPGPSRGWAAVTIPTELDQAMQGIALETFAEMANSGRPFAECLLAVMLTGMDCGMSAAQQPNAQAQPAERSEARLQRNVVREDKR